MFAESEVKKLKKGFHPSRTHEFGNRKTRRANLNNKGIHNPKNRTLLLVVGNSKFENYVQHIPLKDGSVKAVEHCVPVK